MKKCSKCKNYKEEIDFSKDKYTKDRLRRWCKDCDKKSYWNNREHYKKYYLSNKEKIRNIQLLREYGIDLKEYIEIFDIQNGICANPSCNNSAEHLDHNHATGKIRGFLCQSCNQALGMLDESRNKIIGLIEYLEMFGDG